MLLSLVNESEPFYKQIYTRLYPGFYPVYPPRSFHRIALDAGFYVLQSARNAIFRIQVMTTMAMFYSIKSLSSRCEYVVAAERNYVLSTLRQCSEDGGGYNAIEGVIPQELRDDPTFIHQAMMDKKSYRDRARILVNASNRLMDDSDFVLVALKNLTEPNYECDGPKPYGSQKSKYSQSTRILLQRIPKRLFRDRTFVLQATKIMRIMDFVVYASHDIRRDEEFMLEVAGILHSPNERELNSQTASSRTPPLSALYYRCVLSVCMESLRGNKAFLLKYFKTVDHADHLRWATERMKSDDDVVLAAFNLKVASASVSQMLVKKKILLAAANKDPDTLFCSRIIPKDLQVHPDIIRAAQSWLYKNPVLAPKIDRGLLSNASVVAAALNSLLQHKDKCERHVWEAWTAIVWSKSTNIRGRVERLTSRLARRGENIIAQGTPICADRWIRRKWERVFLVGLMFNQVAPAGVDASVSRHILEFVSVKDDFNDYPEMKELNEVLNALAQIMQMECTRRNRLWDFWFSP